MLGLFQDVSRHVFFKKKVKIDSSLSKLYYRITFLIFLLAVVVIGSNYFGEPISCIVEDTSLTATINSYCFISTTFTVPRHMDSSALRKKIIPHPGIGPYDEKEEVTHHAYYQWVPIVLFFQAVLFYLPHYIWTRWEGNAMSNIVSSLEYMYMSYLDEDVNVGNFTIPSKKKKEVLLNQVKEVFMGRRHFNKIWARHFVACELLNVFVLGSQIYFINYFLGGSFFMLGPNFLSSDQVSVLDMVFPKITKCTFKFHGPSGTIQIHDSLCVLAMNVINEKVYVLLWFWFAFLTVLTGLSLLWRLVTYVLHSRSVLFNRLVFSFVSPSTPDVWSVVKVTKASHYSDWLFLYYLAKNLDPMVFRELFLIIAMDLAPAKEKKRGIKQA
ncbi:innexin inx7-like [Periplaneta americana]|uniref:innexin inx7-like n=1 Tax=Periplaneta americana TaxID=6978 RepID=UPI0037E76B5B